eukprot:jgi/Tetstr1/466271/TSEL_000951.t1
MAFTVCVARSAAVNSQATRTSRAARGASVTPARPVTARREIAPVSGTPSGRGSVKTDVAVPTGADFYASLYPESSSDGVLRLGNVVPNFGPTETTMGVIEDFHKEIEGSWTILFSHPADFTPVCTTEIGKLAISYDELASLGCKIYTLSANSLGDHQTWLNDVVAHCENKVEIKFPIIADESREVSVKYGMLDPNNKDGDDLPLTIRAVFIIGPDLKLKLSLNYPASVGRNMEEIVRCVKALKLSADNSIATPANWPNNHTELNMDGKEMKGSVFLLPTVSTEDAEKFFPGFKTCNVPSGKDYLRLVHVDEK